MEPPLRAGVDGISTVAVKLWVALIMGVPLSETTTATVCVEGACAMVGRQENTPLLELMAALAGAVSRLNVKVCAGVSESVAELVTSSVLAGQDGLVGNRRQHGRMIGWTGWRRARLS